MNIPPTKSQIEECPTLSDSESTEKSIKDWLLNRYPYNPNNKEAMRAWCNEIRNVLDPKSKPLSALGKPNEPPNQFFLIALCYLWSQNNDYEALARYIKLKEILLQSTKHKATKISYDIWLETTIKRTSMGLIDKSFPPITMSQASDWITHNMGHISLTEVLESELIKDVFRNSEKDSFKRKGDKDYLLSHLLFAMGHHPDDKSIPDTLPGSSAIFHGLRSHLCSQITKESTEPKRVFAHNALSIARTVDTKTAIEWVNNELNKRSLRGIGGKIGESSSYWKTGTESNNKLRYVYYLENNKHLLNTEEYQTVQAAFEHMLSVKSKTDKKRHHNQMEDPEKRKQIQEKDRERGPAKRKRLEERKALNQELRERLTLQQKEARKRRNADPVCQARDKAYQLWYDKVIRPIKRKAKKESDPEAYRLKLVQYWREYRERLKRERPDFYQERLRRNNEYVKQWRQTDDYKVWLSEYVKGWTHLKNVLNQSAKKRGVLMLLSDEKIQELNQSPCFYCGIFRQIRTIGVDRIQSKGNYEDSNVVPCCTICNFMKCDHDLDEWIDHLFLIYSWLKKPDDQLIYPDNKFSLKWEDFLYDSQRRCYNVELTKEQWKSFHNLPCCYCGSRSTGLERINNLIGYKMSNVAACCAKCNYMRGSWPQDLFFNHVSRILAFYCGYIDLDQTILYDDVPELYYHFRNNQTNKTE